MKPGQTLQLSLVLFLTFDSCILQIARLAGISDTSSVLTPPRSGSQIAAFEVDGCMIQIQSFVEGSLPEVVRCDFGLPPDRDRSFALEGLLKFNCLHYAPGGGASFSLDPASGHVLLQLQAHLRGLPPGESLLLLCNLARMRQHWQDRGELTA
jgi:hypothetical protein